MTGKPGPADVATAMAMDADFSSRVEDKKPDRAPKRKPADEDQLAE